MIADNGALKINDFNNGAPLLKNRKTKQICEVLWPHRCDQEGLDTYVSICNRSKYFLYQQNN